jgi:DNA polymerase-4
LDLDTFFVSVERLLDPGLQGKPVVVGWRPGSAASSRRQATRFVPCVLGHVAEARIRARAEGVYLPTRHGLYGDYAARVRRIAEGTRRRRKIASIDEMFLDFSGAKAFIFAPGDTGPDFTIERTVRKLTDEIDARLGLPSSAGIATSRSVAKVASGIAKPRGVRLVPAGGELAFLGPLPVRKLPGIGPVAEQKLHALGLTTLADVAAATLPALRPIFGAWAESIQRSCQGRGAHELGRERPAFQEHDPQGSAVAPSPAAHLSRRRP